MGIIDGISVQSWQMRNAEHPYKMIRFPDFSDRVYTDIKWKDQV